jgi:glycerol kinase
MNLRSLSWDPAICKELDIPQNVLPTIKSSSEIYGDIKEGSFKGVPLAGCLGDQQAALVGQKCFTPGSVKNTYGTGCFMLYNIGTGPDAILPSKHGLLTTVGYKLGPNADAAYAFEGSVAIAGAGIEWLRSNLEVINDPKEIDKLAGSVPSTGGLFVVPAFSGLFAPYWRPDARGIAIGLTSFTTKAHFARAMLEATAFQTTEILDAMQSDSTVGIKELKVDGGLSKSSLLMQIQSDLLGLPVERPADIETTARGAAYAAGLAVGVYSPPEAASSEDSTVPTPDDDSVRFKPSISEASRAKRMQLWKKAVSRCLDWVNPDHDDTVDHDDDDKEFSS